MFIFKLPSENTGTNDSATKSHPLECGITSISSREHVCWRFQATIPQDLVEIEGKSLEDTQIPKIRKKNLLIILNEGKTRCTWNVFLNISFVWIQTSCINNFLKAKEKQKAIWNPSRTVTYFWKFQLEKNKYFLVFSMLFELTLFLQGF